MAHHGNEIFDDEQAQDKRREFIRDFMGELGATGKFPQGKLTEQDEGELMFGVTKKDGKVVIEFGKSVRWIGLDKAQAIDLGNLLIKRANGE